MNIRYEKLSTLADINPRNKNDIPPDAFVSYVGMGDLNATSAGIVSEDSRAFKDVSMGLTHFQYNDILFAKITPCFENGKIGQAKIQNKIGAGSTEFHVVRPNRDRLDDRYILHYLRHPRVNIEGKQRMTGSSGQRRVPAAFLSNLEVPLLPLEQQQRIAAALDHVDEMREQRRTSIALIDELAKSVFLETFKEPQDNWPSVTVSGIAAPQKSSIRTGPYGSQLLHEEFVEEGIAVLGIDNVVDNEFSWKKPRFITEEKYRKLAKYRVFPGDVLITIMGTCGRSAVVPSDIPAAINTKHLCCITPNKEICLPDFLHDYFLLHPIARSYLQRTTRGAIMSGLNMGIIKELPIRLPPLELQERYAAQAKIIRHKRALMSTHLAELDALFASLQARAFAGEL